ncbi:ATP phosphoribosyltransferase regulatory subunit [Paenibacillus cymbidii]|uniref:ATP phosphoribosyltransferase regulatory subunit n=1 Tax=Paenibacillus cymbidii TaxID=1639034 RepID=UPI0010818ED3|nr:ATP phosphoribosyltransferase regulatory subunit [Paenibacillus cymbidii]
MSKPKVFEKPTGVRDYLPNDAAKLRMVEARVLACMEKWGYSQIVTPALEFYDTVGAASATSDNKLFKLLDQNGRTLVLRSDMTAPIARVVASLLKSEQLPVRLSYHANVFRAFEEEAGRESEFYQTGVELVGDASPEADAEVIALAIAALQAAGVRQFKIALGHVGFLNGLLDETLPGRAEEQTLLKECLLSRNYVGYRQQVKRVAAGAEARGALESILRLRGGDEICEQALTLTQDRVASEAIRHLCAMWDVLKAYGVSEHVLIDLTMIGNFSYYTGMTFEGYAADHGFPVCSGGRYDNLLAQFGRPAPATGFALKTSRILELADDGKSEPLDRVLVLYEASFRDEAFRCARETRSREGVAVLTRRITGEAEGERMKALPAGGYEFDGQRYGDIVAFY